MPIRFPVSSTQRKDTSDVVLTHQRSDAWGNRQKQLGTVRDTASDTEPQASPTLNVQTAGELYRRGPYARICYLYALWTWGALKFDITGLEPEDEKRVRDKLDDLDLRSKGMLADEWGLAFGYSPLFIVADNIGNGQESPSETRLLPSDTKRVYSLHNIPPRYIYPTHIESNRELDTWRQPLVLRIQMPAIQGAGAETFNVHTTRLLDFWGIRDSQVQSTQAVSGLWEGAPRPFADQIYDQLRLLGSLESGANRAALELVNGIFKLGEHSAELGGGYDNATESLQNRINTVSRSLGISRKIALGPGESYEVQALNTTGWKDLSDFGFTMLSLATGIPKALLLGEAPPGLSADKGSWWAQWERTISARRDQRVLPVLLTIIECVMSELGIKVDEWGIEFKPMAELTEQDIADLRMKHTQSDMLLYQAGVLSSDDLKTRYQGGGYRTTLEIETDENDIDGDAFLAELLKMEEESPSSQTAQPTTNASDVALSSPLNGAQLTSALEVLNAINEKIVAPDAAVVLLSGIMPRSSAQAMVAAQVTSDLKTKSEVEVKTEVAKSGAEMAPEPSASPSPTPSTDNPFTGLVEAPADDKGQDSELLRLEERRRLAETMTAYDIDRCEHGRTNHCDICGVERSRSLVFGDNDEVLKDENGKPVWAISWRALGDIQPLADSLDNEFRSKRYKIPSGAQGNARQVLEWRDEHGDQVQGMQETGWRRARQLAKGGTISGEDLITIAAWFARHGAQKETRQVDPEFKDEPWRDNGYVSWLGWGGDTMRSFATDIVDRARKSDASIAEAY